MNSSAERNTLNKKSLEICIIIDNEEAEDFDAKGGNTTIFNTKGLCNHLTITGRLPYATTHYSNTQGEISNCAGSMGDRKIVIFQVNF